MNSERNIPLALIVAAARNRVIGHQGAMPWHLPAELQYFKRRTLGKPVIMGRTTFESIGKPLAGRTNIVISRNSDYTAAGVLVASDLQDAIRKANAQAIIDGAEEIMVIGGGQVYQQAIALADRIYLTEIDLLPPGDTWFPEIDPHLWTETASEYCPGDGAHPAYWLRCLQRTNRPASG